ncbi:MAG: TIGR00303 family protein [Candidatus Melainabacteria bacterium]|nr:TIGR00303 family protein [Candidatus Melainabacteria bacterium]MBI3308827.1 TIGR00303 family protein [Candidatus Melainabacteria bacterium]
MINIQAEKNQSQVKPYNFLSRWKECQDFVNKIKGKKPLFILVIGSTETALIPGLSAAGKNISEIKMTPALDAEFLSAKENEPINKIPVSPSGIPSPIILSKAIVEMLDLDICIVDVGAFTKPKCNHIDLNMGPGEYITKGNALGPIKTNFLFQKGEKLASKISDYPYYVIGECVPGGTTTALSILCALGLNAFGLINSSIPESNTMFKNQIVKDALLDNSHAFPAIKKNPLKAAEHFGDPMQVFVSGLIKGFNNLNAPILLAGGSQMISVYYLASMVLGSSPKDTAIATTSWIGNDKNGNIKQLAEMTEAPLIVSKINFSSSKHEGLIAYENGHIKEGVGAGGLLSVASLYKNYSEQEILDQIEDYYSKVNSFISQVAL